MTSKLTREELDEVISAYGKSHIANRMAVELLTIMDSEPVVFTDERNLHHIAMGRETSLIWGKQNQEAGDIPLYRHVQPAPVVPNKSDVEAEFVDDGRRYVYYRD